ncbi:MULTISPECIES: SCO family protein [unclassified Leptospira]|uniref:SCO family protein n=1 Tax=unclassified Leptospira TaxID=2633828 RepID=UPI0002BE0280|nr:MULTISPECIES: SCO family protein [unclassified Leptospira]EMJ99466.1 SCO1/SenC [Leptospira sp. B5-022]MCR1792351.1 SCO family protein [Leptospira sp. id769339]
MESGAWKFFLTGVIASLVILFFFSHSDPGMIQAEKDVPEGILVLAENQSDISLKSVFSGKQTFLYFGFLHSSKNDLEEVEKFLRWFDNSASNDSQFVFITLTPEKDTYQDLRDRFGKLSENILLLKPANSSSALELARAFGIQAYIQPESGNMKYKTALIWVDDSPKIKGIFPKIPEKPDSIDLPSLLVRAK